MKQLTALNTTISSSSSIMSFISSKSSTNYKTGNKDTTSAILKMSAKFLSREGNGTRPVRRDPFAGTLSREIGPEILVKVAQNSFQH